MLHHNFATNCFSTHNEVRLRGALRLTGDLTLEYVVDPTLVHCYNRHKQSVLSHRNNSQNHRHLVVFSSPWPNAASILNSTFSWTKVPLMMFFGVTTSLGPSFGTIGICTGLRSANHFFLITTITCELTIRLSSNFDNIRLKVYTL